MSTELPDPSQAGQFHFIRHDFNPGSGELSLVYAFDNGPELTERIVFPAIPERLDQERLVALDSAFYLLHLIAGISYYKAGLSKVLNIASRQPDKQLSDFLQQLYRNGLAELAWQNQLSLKNRFSFCSDAKPLNPAPLGLVLPRRSLVALGGGKDSLVTVEWLKSAGLPFELACVGHSQLIADTADIAGLPLHRIDRTLAPEIHTYNRQGAWNGHVPVTAINSAILVCAALIYGFDSVIFSNERSASSANLTDKDGLDVNHQYSKSLEFEQEFKKQIGRLVSPDLDYFSMLRSFGELRVLQEFSKFGQYHQHFSSCNRNFHIDGPKTDGRWCGQCPKCQFAFMGLSLFLPAREVIAIFGQDLLSDEQQIPGYLALCGLDTPKPFECVGEIEESRAAILKLAGADEFKEKAVIAALAPRLDPAMTPALESLLSRHGPDHVMPQLREKIRAFG